MEQIRTITSHIRSTSLSESVFNTTFINFILLSIIDPYLSIAYVILNIVNRYILHNHNSLLSNSIIQIILTYINYYQINYYINNIIIWLISIYLFMYSLNFAIMYMFIFICQLFNIRI